MTHDRSGTPRSRAPSATSASRLTTPSMIAAVLGTEDRGFAFFHLQAILTERVDNVRLVRDNNCVCTGLWCYAEHLAICFGASVVLVRRHHEAAFGEVRCLLNISELCKYHGFVCSRQYGGSARQAHRRRRRRLSAPERASDCAGDPPAWNVGTRKRKGRQG